MADASADRSDRPGGVGHGADRAGRGPVPGPATGSLPTGHAAAVALRRKGEADAWNAFSYVLAGMLLWGGIGWLAGRALRLPALVGVGLMVGTAGGLALVWLRYGRAHVITDGDGTAGPATGSGEGRTP